MKIFIIVFSIFNVAHLYSQQNYFFNNLEMKNFINQGGKISEINEKIFKLQFPSGYIKIFDFNKYEPTTVKNIYIDSIVINVTSLDTNLYADKFKYWKQVNLVNSEYYPMLVDDLNNNGYPELYGYSGRRPNYGWAGPVKAIELNSSGGFDNVFSYDSTILVKAIGDIRMDGRKSIYFHSIPEFTQSGIFYTSETIKSIPTIFDFVLYYDVPGQGFQINDMSFGDYNNDGKQNCAFVIWLADDKIVIGEFDSSINNFYTVFEFDTMATNAAGFAIEDFDDDGKDEIIFNYDETGFYVVEANDEGQFEIVFRQQLPISWPWLHATTNDIDGNGKKEFWFGSVDYQFFTGTTLIGFEAGGNNQYKPIHKIILQNLATMLGTMYLQANDADNDGKEELIISIGNEIVILKFTGSLNEHNYEVFYYKKGEISLPQVNNFFPCSFYDMNKDSLKDLIIPFGNSGYTSYILKQDKTVSVENSNDNKIPSFELSQNYPNPFNPITQINFSLSTVGLVRIKIFDVIGNEIKTLLDEYKTAGKYKIEFDASELPSGIYFYKMISGDYLETKKMILLR
ncbi:MAG: hypothetical protein DAHOPDDO_01024 [Ignavibacteriaceae bacterium]|nr:hypothetical protein [Ignavibacteriaceae bacterium]